MKKLFTLVALLTVFLGAKAVNWDEVKKIDYQGLTDFPYYIMGYAPSIENGIMVDDPVPYRKLWRSSDDGYADVADQCTEVTINGGTYYLQMLESNPWRQYFVADGVSTDVGSNYKVVARVKVSQACTVHVNMGDWSSALGADVPFPASDEFQDVEWYYNEIPVGSCFIIAQPGVTDAAIEWESITVYKQRKEGGRPEVWLEDIENGNAETPWTAEQAAIAYNDMEKNFTICAWSKEKGHNMNEAGDAWNPFPAPIVVDPLDENNHVFLCDGQPATTEGDASAWDNQFWIQSKHSWKSGLSMKIKFRYMANADVSSTDTQIHKQTPSDYLIWHAIGNIHFKDTWQTFEDKMSIADDMAGGWSIAFNLNSVVKDAVKFYFDDLSWQYLLLDEGYFIAGINTNTTTSYDLDNAIEFTKIDDLSLEAVVGTKGDDKTYVNQLKISTTRGADAAFNGATLKPTSKINNDPDEWLEYVSSANAKLDVPGLGVWKVYIDLEYTSMAFEMLEGTADDKEPVAVYTYADEIVVNGQERDFLTAANDGSSREPGGEIGTGETWDNQFFIKSDRALEKGTVTKLKFSYKSSVDAKTTTQCHGETPGAYMHWAAIGDVNFAADWDEFEQEFTIPDAADGMYCIAFNMAEIKEACDYHIKDVQWYLYDASLDAGMTYENLISGSTNFYKKEGAGTTPYTGITNVTAKNAKVSTATYNIAGQRVNKDYKGLVVKDGKKIVRK